ncbi:MAG TPA: AAA family ATPase [Myxococcota bacterium]|nr:AAA family ATPase [Myxococcota bacterium]
MRIVKLNISNFKRIKLVEIVPSGHQVVIGGDNGAGKTSVLDAIMTALVGPRAMPALPVRQGAEGSEITVDCGEVVIRRRIKPDGSATLSVRTPDGMKPSSPQKWLDERVGAISFDPLSFTRLDAKAQAELLRKLVGVDMSDLDAKHAEIYEERTLTNRSLRQAEAVLASMPHHADVPEVEVSVSELIAEIGRINEADALRRSLEARHSEAGRRMDENIGARERALEAFNEWKQHAEEHLNQSLRSVADDASRINDTREALAERIQRNEDDERCALDAQIEELELRLAARRAEREALPSKWARELAIASQNLDAAQAGLASRSEKLRAEYQASVDKRLAQLNELGAKLDEESATLTLAMSQASKALENLDEAAGQRSVADVQAQIRQAERTNAQVRENRAYAEAKAKVESLAKASDEMTDTLARLDNEKRERIASASYPVDGLGFGDDGVVTFGGVPLSQASQAEQIRVSMAIGLALNPELRVVLIRDASLLDDKSLALVAEMAKRADAQVWLERVSKHDAGSIVLEDGEVVSSLAEAEEAA